MPALAAPTPPIPASSPLDATRDDHPVEDHCVFLDGLSWNDYERLLEIRGDRSAPRITYLEGVVEIMSPSRDHERINAFIGRLVEVYCLERGIHFTPYGSWTLKEKKEERGVEADECYVLGVDAEPTRPHLAIEVFWTSGRIDKLEVYRKLEVEEVWIWRRGAIEIYRLAGDAYERVEASVALPELDLDHLLGFLDRPTAYDAIQEYRTALAERH